METEDSLNKYGKFLLSVAIPIAQGLLASGHYTRDGGEYKARDYGKDHAENGSKYRHPANAAEDAVNIANHMINECAAWGREIELEAQ